MVLGRIRPPSTYLVCRRAGPAGEKRKKKEGGGSVPLRALPLLTFALHEKERKKKSHFGPSSIPAILPGSW